MLRRLGVLSAAAALAAALPAQPIVIPTVPVGNPGNAADPRTSSTLPGIGRVDYAYRIGTTEVTNAQYTAFLNAVAGADPYGLYSGNMASWSNGGITRSGTSGSFTYAVKPGMADLPVAFVSYWNAARFVNWLATGFTEGRAVSGGPLLPGAAYDTNFIAAPAFAAGNRLPGATVFLPSENEWYKAAYHQPAGTPGAPTNAYWLFATRSNSNPASANAAGATGANRANFYREVASDTNPTTNGGFAVTQSTAFDVAQIYLTPVGMYTQSGSFYGTFDQVGNLSEWTEGVAAAGTRVARGGSWAAEQAFSRSTSRSGIEPGSRGDSVGFRVASLAAIPEPGTWALLAGAAALAACAWRRRH